MVKTTMILLMALLATLASGQAQAQTQAPAQAPAARAAELTPQQAQQALGVLKDDAKRAAMIGILETIARTQDAAAPTKPAAATAASALATETAPPTAAAAPAAGAAAPAAAAATPKLAIPLAPDSLGAQLLVGISTRLDVVSEDIADTARTLTNFTLLERWIKSLAADPDSRAELLDAGWKLLVVAAIALTIEAAARQLTRRISRRLLLLAPQIDPHDRDEMSETAMPSEKLARGEAVRQRRQRRRARVLAMLRKLPFVLGRFLLDLLPVMATAAAGYGLLGSRLGEPATTKLVILALLNAYLACRVATITVRALLSPDAPQIRLPHIDDALSWTALRWTRRLAIVGLFGYALTEVALLFGLYRVAHDALARLVALSVHLMLVIIVIQNRAAVARLIRAPSGSTGLIAAGRNRIAAVWHIVVIFYIVALWVVFALNIEGGFAKLLIVFVSTVVVSMLARLLVVLLSAWLDHAFALDPVAAARTPGLDHAMRRYRPLVRGSVEAVIALAAFVLLMQIWGLDSLSWFRGDALGARLVSAMATSAITIAVALLIWEASNAAVQNHLARLAREGQPARSARLRTLLPMLRTTLLVAIVMFAGLTILSQIGVNIAPLLAGAGVIGLAIGFGSQKLVQDIITGLFLLLENTMQVGDVVTLAGLTGTVENLSIRVIRLRALDGAVHIVPFSAVTTVTNLTRDFAYALLDVSVGLNEEPEQIGQIVQDVAATMRAEPRWAAAITDSMEIMGVEKFIDTAWVLRCRIKTVASQRWTVSRELNKRLKARFDLDAIESPFTSYRALAAALPAPPNARTEDGPDRRPHDAHSALQRVKIATFNINNVNKRLPNLLAWLRDSRPDVVCLQELKASDDAFPKAALRAAGYGYVWRGQPSWNGVAILARGAEPVVTRRVLPGDPNDRQSRYIEAAVDGVLIGCLYLPNGNPQPGPKFDYKLAWFERLIAHAGELHATGLPVILAGDYNVVPTEADIYSSKSWRNNALLRPQSRAAFRRLLDQGWTDALRERFPDKPPFTFWDTKYDRWPRDAGMRIDHILLSPALAGRLSDAGVDREIRGAENASDHAPAWVVLKPLHGAGKKAALT